MNTQFGPPVGMTPQWAPRGPSQHNQMGQNYRWHEPPNHRPPSGAYATNSNCNYEWQGRPPRYSYGQNSNNNYSQYNIHGNRPVLSCEPCGKTFGSPEILKEHLEEHVQCPFPECRLKACIKIIDQHITNQHILVNFADLQIDNEAWIAQRKKRFPTAERAKIRREQQMEMIRRGQKIGLEKQGFKKNGKYDKVNKYENKSLNYGQNKPREIDTNKEKIINHKKRETFRERKERMKNEKREKLIKMEDENSKLTKSFIDLDVYDSDSEVKDGLPAFKGTKLFYEEIGLTSYFINTKNKLSDIEEVLSDDNIAISDDEEWNMTEVDANNINNNSPTVNLLTNNTTNETSKLVLENALGSLMGAYDSDSEENEENKEVLPHSEPIPNKIINENQEVNKNCMKNGQEGENKNDCKINLEPENKNGESSGTTRRRNRKHRRNKHKGEEIVAQDNSESGKLTQNSNESGKLAQKQIRHVKPRKPPPVKRRRPTLLMRLLEADIRHERNVILQCIRYIVQNNFFEERVECEPPKELTENEQLGVGDNVNINNTEHNGENNNIPVSNEHLQSLSKSASKRKADRNLAESSKAKEAKLLDALTEFHKKNFDRIASMMADEDDEVTSVEAYLNRKK